jgi:dienelactone hydrolase
MPTTPVLASARGTFVARLTLACLLAHGLFATTCVSAETIPLEVLFSQPNFISPKLSPDGDKIAFIGQVGEHQVIGVRDLQGSKPDLIGRNSELQVRWHWLDWANENRLLVGSQTLFRSPESLTKTRFRASRLMGINIDGSKDIMLGKKWPRASFTPVQWQDQVVHWLPDDPNRVLMQVRMPNKRFVTAQVMNVKSGSLRQRDPGQQQVLKLYADGTGTVRVGTGLMNGFLARKSDADEYQSYAIKRSGEAKSYLSFAGFSADPNVVYVYDTLNDFVVLRKLDLSTRILMGEPMGAPGYDVKFAFDDPVSGNVMGNIYVSDFTEYVFIDPAAKAAYAHVLQALPATENTIVSTSRDATKAILKTTGDTLPPHFYLYDRNVTPASFLPIGRTYPKLSKYTLIASTPVSYLAGDGLEIHGYLTLPAGNEDKNLPTVIMPHGGPVSRDFLRYDAEVQFLANRGYAVFRMNFRGSSGYGKKFRNPAFKAWGARMQDDVSDGVQWLIDEGIADQDRIAIFGTSYGGYAALMSGVRTPGLYQAIASYAPVTYLPWLENEANEAIRSARFAFKQMSQEALKTASPTEHAAAFNTPVLLGHGDLDQRVNVRHSRRMADVLNKAAKNVQYLEFEDEIHGFLLQENRLRWYAALETFLAEHIGLAKHIGPDDRH